MNESKTNYSTFKLLQRIIQYAKPYWLSLISIFLLTLLASPIALLKPYALKLLIDSGFGKAPLPAFITMFFPNGFEFSFYTIVLISAVFVIIVALIDNIINVIEWVLGTYTGEKLVLRIRSILFNHIQRLSLAYHDKKGASDSLYRVQWDTMSIRSLLISNLSPLLSSVLTLLARVTVMFTINWRFAVIALCVMPPLFFLTRYSAKILRRDWNKVKEDESHAISVIHEVLGALRVVKAFGQEDVEGQRFLTRADKAVKGQLKMAWVGALFYFLVGIIFAIGTALFIYLGATYVHEGKMTLGELTLIIAYLAQVFGPLQNISKSLNDIQSSISGVERVFTLLDQEKEVVELPNSFHIGRAAGSFEIKHIHFAYNIETPTLSDVSFDIKPGDRVGVMGSTGAGKSTLINLITRFYDVQRGMILMDGMDIKKIKLADYRQQFAIVLQDPILFSTTIGENIAYGFPGASQDQIIAAAKMANAHDFIIRSKDGYNTLVGERGMHLSGGERQRISLARAFIKNAPMLIMDEPTSSLDVKTEAQIMDAMQRLMEGRTTFMITHRLDTLRFCNVILHMEDGKLIDMVRDYDENYIEEKKSLLMQYVEG